MAEQDMDQDSSLNDEQLDVVSGGGVIINEARGTSPNEQNDKLRANKEQEEKISSAEQLTK